MKLRVLAAAVVAAAAAAFAACADDIPQGDDYVPDGRLPIEPASERRDGAVLCDGAACDAGAIEAGPDPLADASNQPTNTCETARAIGTMAGDKGAPSLTAQGTCSDWVSFRATEDDSSPLGVPMKTKLTLVPTGGDFDLFAYFDPVRDLPACARPFSSSYQTGTATENVSLTWGEGSVANGSDDGRTIDVLVLKAGGPCGPDAGSWKLTAEGNK